MKCAILKDLDHQQLEKQINTWLDKNLQANKIHSIHYSTAPHGAYVNYSALIIYY